MWIGNHTTQIQRVLKPGEAVSVFYYAGIRQSSIAGLQIRSYWVQDYKSCTAGAGLQILHSGIIYWVRMTKPTFLKTLKCCNSFKIFRYCPKKKKNVYLLRLTTLLSPLKLMQFKKPPCRWLL